MIISQQKNEVPELQERVASLRRQVDASRKIVELKKKLRSITRELAWSYVVGKEKAGIRINASLTDSGTRRW